jgi:hypothetical protein
VKSGRFQSGRAFRRAARHAVKGANDAFSVDLTTVARRARDHQQLLRARIVATI